jgi:hypothetical protein
VTGGAAPPGRGKHPVLRRRRMKSCAGARAEAHGEATLWGSLSESTGPENVSLYARGVDDAHVGEILDVFGVNGSSAARRRPPRSDPQARRAQNRQDTP